MASPPSTLVLLAHPALERSRVNRRLAQALGRLEYVRVHDLYEEYPDFDIDVRREQKLLAAHERIVLQHPIFWYSTPALVKQWEDVVLEYGWAYGRGGTALHGKQLLSAVSTAGSRAAYTHAGFHGITLHELLAPLRQTARLCGMSPLEPFVVYGAHHLSGADIERAAEEYVQRLSARPLLDAADPFVSG